MEESGNVGSGGPPIQPAPRRQRRVALACQRCKHRKQRCDGAEPSCSTCVRLKARCLYVSPTNYKPREAKIYITALEDRIAELELSLANQGNPAASHDHWSKPNKSQDDGDPLLSAVRDLSLNTGGSYVGSTSNITLARILASIVGLQDKAAYNTPQSVGEMDARAMTSDDDYQSSPSMEDDSAVSLIGDDEVTEKLVTAFIKCISPRFPVLHPAHVRSLYERRAELNDPYHRSILHLVYALGGVFLVEALGENIEYRSAEHLEAALQNRDAILSLADARTLIYLLLLAQQCLRVPKKMGAWTLVGLAMRLCIELGFHRRKRTKSPSVKSEIEKRLFWSCYYLDRELSISLGRPPSISDHDIDVELPLDVDDSVQDVDAFNLASLRDQSQPANPPTNLTYFIHLIRLKRIQSEIQTTIYRVDAVPNPIESERATDRFLDSLASWKKAIPPKIGTWDVMKGQKPAYREDVYMISYHRCVRLLLQPQLYAKVINDRYFELCMESCRGVCEGYKRMYHHMPMSFSALALQTVFIAGLTLVYCLWYKNSTTAAMANLNALNDCSILLYIMTERWNASSKYRDAFESIKRTVIELVSEGKNRPRRTVAGMSDEVRDSLQGIDVGMAESHRDALEQMISGMTGEQLELDVQPMDIPATNGLHGYWDRDPALEAVPVDFDLTLSYLESLGPD
ncbi:fungal-specific transcription factor domain-containing protein [Xylariales sp. PMI_506]|nr:fungal-specific transcription factor domain-containing protein [Xylariales sp. PMI_506]